MRALFRRILFVTLLITSAFCGSSSSMTKLIDQQEIDAKVKVVARELSQEYQGRRLVVMSVLKGAIFISADIMGQLDIPFEIEFVKCTSYRGGLHSGKLDVRFLNEINIENKDLLIIDDIYDSGKTMLTLIDRVKQMKPASIKSLVLLKKRVTRESKYEPDYTLFEIQDRFVPKENPMNDGFGYVNDPDRDPLM